MAQQTTNDADEYPIIDDDLRVRFQDSGDVMIVLGLWVDEDGNTQVRINDHWSEKRTVTPDDIYDRMDREGYDAEPFQ